MIFADGAGACILGDTQGGGNISTSPQTLLRRNLYLYFDKSNHRKRYDNTRFIKMNGRKVYELAVINVPEALRVCLEKSGESIENVKVFIQQANEKYEAIISAFIAKKEVLKHNAYEYSNRRRTVLQFLFSMIWFVKEFIVSMNFVKET